MNTTPQAHAPRPSPDAPYAIELRTADDSWGCESALPFLWQSSAFGFDRCDDGAVLPCLRDQPA